ncbi:HNH endonuclease [Vibrio phage K460]
MARSPENEMVAKIGKVAPYLGKDFKYLKVLKLVEESGATKVECLCVCGDSKVTLLSSLKSGNTTSCGCNGILTKGDIYYTRGTKHPYCFLGYVNHFNESKRCFSRAAKVIFLETGNEETFIPSNVKEGSIVDKLQPIVSGVGFLGKGLYNSKSKVRGVTIYSVWGSMINRCYNKADWRYHVYGGRNVSVDKEWLNFQNFAEWYFTERSKLPENVEYQIDKDLKDSFVYSSSTCLLIPKSLNITLQMSRPNGNPLLSTGVRFVKGTGKYVAQVTKGSSESEDTDIRGTGKHRDTLEEAKEDYVRLKRIEIDKVAENLFINGLISEEVKHLVNTLDIKSKIENYKGETL